MLTLQHYQLPCPEADLRAALQRYVDAREAHKSTVGEPAPWPEHDIIFDILRHGGEFTVVYPPPPSPREVAMAALAERRKQEAEAAENEMLVLESLKPDAPEEVKAYVASIPALAERQAELAAAQAEPPSA